MLDALLDQPHEDQPRIVVLEGMPGVGKTALAIHWAHMIAGRFPGGQLFLDLRGAGDHSPLTSEELLWQALIALGMPRGQIPDRYDARAAAYQERISDKKALILLDNVGDEAQVRELLPRSAGPLTLLTSRSHLRELPGHNQVLTVEVGVLTSDDAAALLVSVIGERRVADEPGAAKELAAICGYLPLALRIVAANLAREPDSELAEAVRDLEQERLSALTLRDDPSIAVRATLDVSYRGLDENIRRTFRLLGLFEGTVIPAEAAAALLDVYPEDAHPLLARLRLANLIESDAPGRYRFHDLLRDYARERVIEDEDQAARQAAIRRLLLWYIATALEMGDFLGQRRRRIHGRRASSAVTDRQDRENRLGWFESERQNLVAVTKQAASMGEDRLTWEIADAVYDFFKLRSYANDNVEIHRLGLSAAQHANNLPAQIYMIHHLSVIYRLQGEYDLALDEAKQALTASKRLRNSYFEAVVCNNLAEISYAKGDYGEARRNAEKALALRRNIGDRLGEADTLNIIARTQRALGRYSESFQNARAALAIRQEIGDHLGEAETFDLLGRLYRLSGAYPEALDCGYEALTVRREHDDRLGEGESLQSLARVYRRLGVYSRAQEYAGQALRIMEDVGNAKGVAEAHATLGDIYLDSSRESDALEPYRQAIAIRTRIGDQRGLSESHLSMARAYRKSGNFVQSLTDAQQALNISGKIGDRFDEARALDSLARTYRLMNQHDRALEYAEEALEIQRTIGDKRGEGNSLVNIAEIYRRAGRYGTALEFAKSACKVLKEDEDQRGQAQALDSMALIQLELGQIEPAIEAARKAAEMWAKLADHRSLTATLDVLVKIATAGESGPGAHTDADGNQHQRSLFRAFIDGFGGIFDIYGTAHVDAEPLPSFESTLAENVHALCLANGLIPEGDNEHTERASQGPHSQG